MFAPRNNIENLQSKAHLFGSQPSGFVQPKLNMGTPGDRYEREADRAADQIVAKGKDNSASFITPGACHSETT